MKQSQTKTLILISLLLLVTACTVTRQATETVDTPLPSTASTREPLDEPTVEPIVEKPTAVSQGNEIGGYVELVDALRAAGANVQPVGDVNQPFFSVAGQVIGVNGGDVQVFEYPDAATARAEAALISPTASSVGTSMVTWVATPHFYMLDRVIALYVGEDRNVIDHMSGVLGLPVAEGQIVGQSPAADETAAYPADTRTGLAGLDAIIDAVLGHDQEALRSLTQYTVVGCTHADGLGGPPKCEADEEEGSSLEVVPFLGPEGHHQRRADYEVWPGPEVRGLAAAYRVSSDVFTDVAYPAGEYAIVFLGPNDMMHITLQVTRGRVVRFDFGIGTSLAAELERAAAEMILPLYGTGDIPQPVTDTTALLEEALVTVDYGALESLMGESLTIGYWLSEGQTLTPAQAVEQLRLNLLPNPAAVSFVRDRALFPDLGNFDPATAFGPDVKIVDLVYSQGWGTDASAEAILTIAEGADGSQYWQGIVYAYSGFTAPPAPLETATLLSDAFAAADYDALQVMMGETFSIGYWLSEGQTLTPAQAVEQLRLNLLPDPAAVSFIRDRALFPDLGSIDPSTAFGPDVQIVDLVYSQGWGSEGSDEAILTIAESADGTHYWHGMLIGRFTELAVAPVQVPTSYESSVYRNSENGFTLSFPASWHLDEQLLGSRASGALFYVADTDEEPIFSAVVFLWDPTNDLDGWLDVRRQSWSGSGATVLSEEELTVAGGHRAIQFELHWPGGQTTNYLFMEVGERYLELFGSGDLELFGEIIGTLRFVEPGS